MIQLGRPLIINEPRLEEQAVRKNNEARILYEYTVNV